jgi:hypothetical protein
MPLFLLIPLAWLGVSALLLAVCRAAALGDRTRVAAIDPAGNPRGIPRRSAETPTVHQHPGSSNRAQQPRSARPHSRSLHASTR